MTYCDVDEPHVHRISTRQKHTVLTNLYVRAIIIAFLVPYLVDRHDVLDWSTAARIGALGNRDFAVGGDGRRCGHSLNVYRDVHPMGGRGIGSTIWKIWLLRIFRYCHFSCVVQSFLTASVKPQCKFRYYHRCNFNCEYHTLVIYRIMKLLSLQCESQWNGRQSSTSGFRSVPRVQDHRKRWASGWGRSEPRSRISC